MKPLTARQVEVLQLVAMGIGPVDICFLLGISDSAFRGRKARCMENLDWPVNDTHAVYMATSFGILPRMGQHE